MSREDIIRMAREAECEETWGADAFRFGELELERFFKLAYDAGRKTAQERCAQIADAHASIEGIAQKIAAEIRGQG